MIEQVRVGDRVYNEKGEVVGQVSCVEGGLISFRVIKEDGWEGPLTVGIRTAEGELYGFAVPAAQVAER